MVYYTAITTRKKLSGNDYVIINSNTFNCFKGFKRKRNRAGYLVAFLVSLCTAVLIWFFLSIQVLTVPILTPTVLSYLLFNKTYFLILKKKN